MIYIGKFLHATSQQKKEESERRHGEFNLIIEAEDQDSAVDKFKERIVEFRKTSDLFEGECSIYMVHLLELNEFPKGRAKMLYYKSIAGDPVMPYISCSTPSGETEGCRIVNWMERIPELDGHDAHLFIQFKP
ncbi:MAG: hypothetical protein JSV31_15720 [Desulfobacterales bacterium]|jgi:hypothetical protein|nr:MAG: hypothetical protein JSV31_15720 [Desulfobacterales bacterium]